MTAHACREAKQAGHTAFVRSLAVAPAVSVVYLQRKGPCLGSSDDILAGL